jgi:hypothetical protein
MVRMTYQPKPVYTNGHHTDDVTLAQLRTAQSA